MLPSFPAAMTSFRRLLSLPLLGVLLALSGCLYDNPPSGPSCSLDTWLLGRWEATDKAGHHFTAVMTPATSDRYHLSLIRPGKSPLEFDAWISRVDGFSILVLKSLDEGPTFGKHALYHYELLAPGTPPPGGIGARRMRLSELQLDESARQLGSYRLRAAIRAALKDGSLIVPYDIVAARKEEAKEAAATPLGTDLAKPEVKSPGNAHLLPELLKVPGSVIWTRTSGVTLNGETF